MRGVGVALTLSRYSWFGAMADANHLGGVSRVNMMINDGGDGLTPLGRLYLGQID